MRQCFVLATVILALGLFSNPLQASPLKLIKNFFRQPATASREPRPLEFYPPETFPDFQVAEPVRWLGNLPPGMGQYPESLAAPPLPALLSPTCTPPQTGAAAPLQLAPKPSLFKRVKDLALRQLHTPYRRGGSLQTGRATDCSGFVRYVYHKLQIDLPHSSAQQARHGKVAARRMDFSKLQVGDLLFFSQTHRSIGHVGIYLGEGKMIHASSRRRGVIISNLEQTYYAQNFVVAKRLLKLSTTK